jgi:hypothetical protein
MFPRSLSQIAMNKTSYWPLRRQKVDCQLLNKLGPTTCIGVRRGPTVGKPSKEAFTEGNPLSMVYKYSKDGKGMVRDELV